jgi:cell division protein FtsB
MKKYLSQIKPRRLIVIAVFVILFFLLWDLNGRLTELFHLTSERDHLATEVAQLTSTQAALQTQIVFVGSDAGIEQWAREEAHMIKPGDKLIVLLPPPGATPNSPIKKTATSPAVQNYQVWWKLFFGE